MSADCISVVDFAGLEKQAAMVAALNVRDVLRSLGWPHDVHLKIDESTKIGWNGDFFSWERVDPSYRRCYCGDDCGQLGMGKEDDFCSGPVYPTEQYEDGGWAHACERHKGIYGL